MSAIFGSSQALFCCAELNGYFSKVSDSWSVAMGWSSEELMTNPYMYFIHPADIQKTIDVVENMKKGIAPNNFINRYRCQDGSYRTLLWMAPQFSSTGKTYAFALIIPTEGLYG
jgi:two-component system NtrC family sensor kinase